MHRGEPRTMIERIFSNACNTIWNCNAGKASATRERIVTNLSCSGFYLNYCICRHSTLISIKNTTGINNTIRLVIIPRRTIKRILSNTGNAVRNYDVCKVCVTIERIFINMSCSVFYLNSCICRHLTFITIKYTT